MEFVIIVVLVLAALAFPVALVVLIVLTVRYGRRITELEARVSQLDPNTQFEPLPAESTTKSSQKTNLWQRLKARKAVQSMSAELNNSGDPDAVSTSETLSETQPKTSPTATPRSFVFRAGKLRSLGAWLTVNWIYLVAAASLALAGIFLLQYGIEKGILSPSMRVALALGFGALLIGFGEYVRRRWGDGEDASTAFLPSVFSGAGIVTLFAAILAALHLYTLIGPITALIGMTSVAVIAIVLGWYSGPLLAAVGILGAMISPYVIGGENTEPAIIYAYFGIVTLVGMLIDALRRWAWVTVLSLVSGYGAAVLLFALADNGEGLLAFASVMAVAAIIIPPMRLIPTHQGAAMADMFAKGLPKGWPDFPVRIAWGAGAASVAIMVVLSNTSNDLFWLSIGLMAGYFILLTFWARRAVALEDMNAGPILGVLAALALHGTYRGQALVDFHAFLNAAPGTAMPMTAYILTGLGAGISLIAAWRSLSNPRWPIAWAAIAALTGPLIMVVLEVWWEPAKVMSPYAWALVATAMAGLMALMAGWFVRPDGDDKRRVALFVLAALSMVSFACVIVLSDAALTVALAVTMLAAALLDRRFNMAPLAFFVQVMVVAIGGRLLLEPGLTWAVSSGLPHVILAFGGAIAAFIASYFALRPQGRTSALIMLESATWSLTAIFLSVLVYRLFDPSNMAETHLSVGLMALVWLISSANQLWRLQAGGKVMWWVRIGLASLFAATGLTFLGGVMFPLNPLFDSGNPVIGPVLLNSLLLAYLAPALFFGFVAKRFTFLPNKLRIIATILGSFLAVLWLALAIRHFWQGVDLSKNSLPQGELYSYTIAMLTIGAGALYQAIAKGSTALRRVAMAIIALTVAKVYLIDMSGLTGLTRVFSFLALGLSLAGLAWLNRWATNRAKQKTL